jgi:hypothetical protein
MTIQLSEVGGGKDKEKTCKWLSDLISDIDDNENG